MRDYKGHGWDFDALIEQLWRVTCDGGVVMWNVADQTVNGSETGTSFRQALKFLDQGWRLHDTMIYEKGNFSNPSSNRYHNLFEYMFVFSKGKPRTFNPIKDKPTTGMNTSDHAMLSTFGKNTVRQKDGTMVERGTRKTYEEFGMRGNIWRMKTAGQEKPCHAIAHPAKMPTAMAYDHIISWSNPGDLVLDPFAGSGTTGIQALQLGRRFVGTEIAPEYFDMMNTELQNLQSLSSLILPQVDNPSPVSNNSLDK
jgi:site-specific DNA-methyltransferase (adenine-specific)